MNQLFNKTLHLVCQDMGRGLPNPVKPSHHQQLCNGQVIVEVLYDGLPKRNPLLPHFTLGNVHNPTATYFNLEY
jgi:hypothetical protein